MQNTSKCYKWFTIVVMFILLIKKYLLCRWDIVYWNSFPFQTFISRYLNCNFLENFLFFFFWKGKVGTSVGSRKFRAFLIVLDYRNYGKQDTDPPTKTTTLWVSVGHNDFRLPWEEKKEERKVAIFEKCGFSEWQSNFAMIDITWWKAFVIEVGLEEWAVT